MTRPPHVLEGNWELFQKIDAEARANPHSVYAGKFVGLANGRVIVVTDNLDELARRLRQAEPDPLKTFGFEAGVDYSEVQEIWGLH